MACEYTSDEMERIENRTIQRAKFMIRMARNLFHSGEFASEPVRMAF
jgi:hypothetical protein